MNMAEIATMVQEGIEVKLAIFNNGYLGMVRQWQQFFHGKRYSSTPIWSPDYVKLAEAYGIPKDRKSTRLNSSHITNSYAVFCLKKKNKPAEHNPRDI